MTQAPQITIITPVFNGARHIEACMNSVRSQGVPDVEHLIVDGGSTDGTIDIVRDRMAADPLMRLLEGPDRGQSNAMNKGIVAAAAPILGCLNVDDRYLPGAIALAIARLSEAPEPSFLWGACEVHDHLHGTVWTQYPGHLERWRLLLGWDFEPHPVNPVAYFYHRSLHFRAGLFDEAEHYALDLEFILRAVPHIRQVITVRDLLGVYEMAPGTKTFEDLRRGESGKRVIVLFQKYKSQLSRSDRIRIRMAQVKLQLMKVFH